MIKYYRNVEEQIQQLLMKGLTISHPIRAKKLLKTYNYYALTAYKLLFYKPGVREYIPGTDLDDLYSMYLYDKDIKILILKELLFIEQRFKTAIGIVLSEKYGVKETDYLARHNFDMSSPYIDVTLFKIEKQLNEYGRRSRSVVHYKNKYGYLPFWVLSKCLTIGVIRDLYFIMKPNDQNIVARMVIQKPIMNKPVRLLKSFISFFADIRNMCAHDEMLINFRHSRLRLPPLPEHDYLSIEKSDFGEYLKGRNDILALLISISYFESRRSFNLFFKRFVELTTKNYLKIRNIVSWDPYLEYIGLCKGFEKLSMFGWQGI